MYKLLFGILVALIALVVAWLGLQPLDKVALTLRLEPGKTYKVWITSEREIETPDLEDYPRGWDENRRMEFRVEAAPDDSLAPGSLKMTGMGQSGGGATFMPAFASRVDSTDTLAVRQYYLRQLPRLAAENISSLLVPLYFANGVAPLKIAASLVAEPFDDPESLDSTQRKIPKVFRVRRFDFGDQERMSEILEQYVQNIRALYSDKPVSAGASWKVITDSILGVPVAGATGVKVREQNGGKVILDLNSTAGDTIRIDTCGVYLTIVFNATMTGALEVDEASGMIFDGELKQHVDGVLMVDSLPGMVLPEPAPFSITSNFKLLLGESLYSRTPPDNADKRFPRRDSTAAGADLTPPPQPVGSGK